MGTLASEVAFLFLQSDTIKLQPKSPFTSTSGLKRPIQIDQALVSKDPKLKTSLKTAIKSKLFAFGGYQKVIGPSYMTDYLDQPVLSISEIKKEKEPVLKGSKVLILKSFVGSGKRSMETCQIVKDKGGEVAGMLALFSFGLDIANRKFTDNKIPFDALTNYPTLLRSAIKHQFINKEDLASLEAWISDPKSWSQHYIDTAIHNENYQ